MGSLLAALVNQASGFLGAGAVPERMGNRHPSIAPYESFARRRRRDRRRRRQRPPVRGAVRRAGRRARSPATSASRPTLRVSSIASALLAALGPRFAARTRVDLAAALNAAGVPCGPVNDVRDAFALAATLGLGSIVEMAEGVRQVANPIALDGDPGRLPPRAAAARGRRRRGARLAARG